MKSTIQRHPKGVAFLAFTQMWESFSFFGMRALLVLYLISEIHYDPKAAFILYTLYIAFAKVFAAIGGYLSDRFLGYKQAVLIGGAFILMGHLLLTFSEIQSLFFLGLGSIVCGASLFRVSLQALLSMLYEKDDPQREKGFTLLYVGMNLGGLLAATLCGFMANSYGWHVGFGLAAFGMAISMITFFSKFKSLPSFSPARKVPLPLTILGVTLSTVLIGYLLSQFQEVHTFALPLGLLALGVLISKLGKTMTKKLLIPVVGAFFLLIAYFTIEELWGSLLMLFSETHIERRVCGIEIPSSVVAAMNPLTIILLGPFIAKMRIQFGIRLSLAFLALSFAFFLLYAASMIDHPSILYLVSGLSLIALGELFLAPSILSFCSASASQGSLGMMMGGTTLALSMGSLLSGEVAKIPFDTTTLFLWIGLTAFGLFGLLLVGCMPSFRQAKSLT